MDFHPTLCGQKLRVCDILRLLVISHSCLYEQIAAGRFPPLVRYAARTVSWPAAVLPALVAHRQELRDHMTHRLQPVSIPHWTAWYAPLEQPPEVIRGDFQLLKVGDVARHLGVSVPTVYRWIRQQRLPAPVPLTQRARRWISREVAEWDRSRIALSMRIAGELPARRSRRQPAEPERPRP